MVNSMKTPRELGLRMPAEWEEHAAVWLSWPHDPITFPLGVSLVEEQYANVIKALQKTKSEMVKLFVLNSSEAKRISSYLTSHSIDTSLVEFHIYDYADVWIRDYGPTFLIDQHAQNLSLVNWRYNAWGNKYEALLKDDAIPSYISSKMNINSFHPGIVMEGGAIDVNGSGSLLTTKQCLLNPNRNPHLSQKDIETYLKDYYSVSNVIWLNEGVEGDDTDGHIDDIARFVSADTIAYAWQEDPQDKNHHILLENLEILKKATDETGKPFNLVPIAMPSLKASTSCSTSAFVF
jgi:agmatine deiminase